MRISALLLGALFAVGCSSANKDIEKFADRACECKDVECGKKVMEDFLGWAKENKDARGDEDAAKKSFEKMTTCISKLRADAKAKPEAPATPATP